MGQVMIKILKREPLDAWMKEVFASSTLSRKFESLVRRCLVSDPAKRPTAKELLEHEFFGKHARDADWLRENFIRHLPSKGAGGATKRTPDRRRLTNQRVIHQLLQAGE